MLLLASKGAFAMLEFAKQEFLAEPIVQHVNYSVHGLHSIAESASR